MKDIFALSIIKIKSPASKLSLPITISQQKRIQNQAKDLRWGFLRK